MAQPPAKAAPDVAAPLPGLATRLHAPSLSTGSRDGKPLPAALPVSRPKPRGPPPQAAPAGRGAAPRLQPLAAPATPPAAGTTVRSLDEVRKPALPPVGSQPPTAAAAEPALDVAALGHLTPPEIAELLARHGERLGFLYLGFREDPRTSNKHHAYNLRVVPYEQVDPDDYFTVSSRGLTHVTGKASEFTPLERWVQEYESFTRIKRKPFFLQFRLWKSFALWRKSVLSGKREAALEVLRDSLFFASPVLGAAALRVRGLCLDVVQMRLCVLPAGTTYQLADFVAAQQAQAAAVAGQLGTFRAEVLGVVQRACRQTIADAAITIELPGQAAPSPPLSYTEQARRRALFQRLASFIRLMDLLVVGAMQALVVESVALLHDRMRLLEDAALLPTTGSQPQFEEVPAPAPGAAPATPAAIAAAARHNVPYWVEGGGVRVRVTVPVEKKPSKVSLLGTVASDSSSDGRVAPLLRVGLDVDGGKLAITPELHDTTAAVRSVTELFERSVIGVPPLLPDGAMASITQPRVNGRTDPAPSGDGVSLEQVLREDEQLQSLRANIARLLSRGYALAASYGSTVDYFRTMLETNQNQMAQWAPGNKHSPEVYRQSLQSYLEMHSRASSLPGAVDVGAMHITCHAFRDLLLPSPARCIAGIKELLPQHAAEETKLCLGRMDDAVTQLEATPSTTLEFMKLLTFVHDLDQTTAEIEHQVKLVSDLYEVIAQFEIETRPEHMAEFQTLRSFVIRVRDAAKKAQSEQAKLVEQFTGRLDKDISDLGARVLELRTAAQDPRILDLATGVDQGLSLTGSLHASMNELQEAAAQASHTHKG